MKLKRFFLCICACVIFGSTSFGVQQPQQRQQSTQDDEPIKLKATLVQVPVIVSNGGRYVTDMKKEDFELIEDGMQQSIEFFGSIDQPFNVALLLDSSGSTADQLNEIKLAALAFVDNLRAQDRVMIVSFNDSVEVMCEMTADRDKLRRGILNVRSGEYTQVYEAVYTAVWERLSEFDGRKAVILFTDGIDTASSEISADDTLDAVAETEDVIVYPIRYSTRADSERRIMSRVTNRSAAKSAEPSIETSLQALDREYRKADEYLQKLADESGGIVERADRLGDLTSAFARIAEELRHQYVLGYYPPDDKPRNRRITVRVSRPGLKVRSRPGYRN